MVLALQALSLSRPLNPTDCTLLSPPSPPLLPSYPVPSPEMDRFYLDNTGLYQRLVAAYKPAPGAAVAEETSSDMVVSARVRPLLDQDIDAGFPCAVFPRPDQPGVADVHDLYNHPRGRPVLRSFDYRVDKLFDAQASTDEIYDDLVADLAPLAWNGGTGTLFAYGQTGSGKTFTVSRLEELVVQTLMQGNLPGERQIFMTMVELAGNSAFDLLRSRRPVSILEDALGVTQLSGADEVLVRDEAEAMRLIRKATFFRRTAPTRKNDGSSRSHGICRLRIADPAAAAAGGAAEGLLYLVDLAGSEAARDVAAHGADRMRETREINISLSVLKDCIRAKAQADAASASARKPKKTHVPFRQSALTKVLKHVFDPPTGRACKTVVIACVNPSLGDAGASKNTLRYAEMLRVVLPTATKKPNSDLVAPGAWSNAQLQDWIAKNVSRAPFLESDATDTAVPPISLSRARLLFCPVSWPRPRLDASFSSSRPTASNCGACSAPA